VRLCVGRGGSQQQPTGEGHSRRGAGESFVCVPRVVSCGSHRRAPPAGPRVKLRALGGERLRGQQWSAGALLFSALWPKENVALGQPGSPPTRTSSHACGAAERLEARPVVRLSERGGGLLLTGRRESVSATSSPVRSSLPTPALRHSLRACESRGEHALPLLVFQRRKHLLVAHVGVHALDLSQLHTPAQRVSRTPRCTGTRRGAVQVPRRCGSTLPPDRQLREVWNGRRRTLRARSRFSNSSAMLRCNATRCAMMVSSPAVSARPSKSRNKSSVLHSRLSARRPPHSGGCHAPLGGNLLAALGQHLLQALGPRLASRHSCRRSRDTAVLHGRLPVSLQGSDSAEEESAHLCSGGGVRDYGSRTICAQPPASEELRALSLPFTPCRVNPLNGCLSARLSRHALRGCPASRGGAAPRLHALLASWLPCRHTAARHPPLCACVCAPRQQRCGGSRAAAECGGELWPESGRPVTVDHWPDA